MSAWVKTPGFLPRVCFFAVLLTLFFTFSFAIPASAADIVVDDNPPSGCQANAAPFCNIQPAIDAAAEGDVIKVYPGTYNETATGRWVLGTNGPHQFGLFIDKNNITIQGVTASGQPIQNYADVAAFVTTNATNNFGYSGTFVQGDGVTLSGLSIGANLAGENKTIEVIGDNFALKFSRIDAPGGAVYFGDWRYNTATDTSYIKGYTVEGNLFPNGARMSLVNGTGVSGPVANRVIRNNRFELGSSPNAAIAFKGPMDSFAWYVHPVGGAIVTGNTFTGGEQLIIAAGEYDNTDFDWQSLWNTNSAERKVVTLVGATGFDVRNDSSGTYENLRQLGTLVQTGVNYAAPGDTVLVQKGLYAENVTINKHVRVIGAGSGSDPAADTVLRPPSGNVVTITGSGVSDADPLLLKNLRIEPQGTIGINLGNGNAAVAETISYLRLEDVQVVGTPNQAHTENERGLNLDLNKSLSHLAVVNSTFSQCDHGWYFTKHNDPTFTPNMAQYITVSNSRFVDNGYKGIYVELLSDATFDTVLVTGNGLISNWNARWNAGIDVNLKGGIPGQVQAYQNLVFRNMTMTGNGLGARDGAALMIKVRDDGSYTPRPATLTNVLVESGLFTGNERGIRIGEPGKNNAGPFNVQIHNASIYGNNPTYVEDLTVTGDEPTAPGGLVNQSTAAVNAENNWWGSASGPAAASNPPNTGGAGELVNNATSGSIDYVPWLGMAPSAVLFVPSTPVDLATGATSFILPVNLVPGADSFSSAAFSLDYDTACLRIDPADANGDGIPEAISGLPGGFVNSIMLDTADSDGELDIAMWDVAPPMAALPAGAIVKITFNIQPACQGPNDRSTYLKFSSAPAATFSDIHGYALYRNTQGADPLLLDYNQAPTAINLAPSNVAENAPVHTEVGTLTTVDADGDAPAFALAATCAGGALDNAEFSLMGNKLFTAAIFNREQYAAKSVCVEANDGQGETLKAALTVTIDNVNEPPTAIALSNNKVAEGAAMGSVVGVLSTSGDPEGATSFVYTPATGDGDADNGKFEIVGDLLKTKAIFDYQVQPVLYVRVRSTDPGGAYVEKQFVITVLDHSRLSIADNYVVKHGESKGIDVVFTANGNVPSSAQFALTYNSACLAYGSVSSGTATNDAANGILTVNTNGPFVDGAALVTINFSAKLSCPSGTSVPLAFTSTSLNNGALPVSGHGGKVLVISNSARGDCNSDGFVNAGDFSAIVLETFDTDAAWWLEAPKSTFPGSPIGCDANKSQYIDVADVVCTVLVVFGNSQCTGGALVTAEAEAAALAVAPVAEGQTLSAAISLEGKGANVAGAAFTFTFDPKRATFDTTDSDGDGIPDAVQFAVDSGLKRSVSVDAAAGRIKIAVYGLSLPLPKIEDGLVATVRLEALGTQPLAGVGLVDAALANANGSNTAVEVEVGGAGAIRPLYLPAISH